MSRKNSNVDSVFFPTTFETRDIETNGATIHTRIGGQGAAVVLLHGFGTTGDMWAPLAAALVAEHTVIVPDLRGLGLSSKPSGGYDKKTQSRDVASVMNALSVPRADFVTHDIGNMVGYAFAAGYSDRVTRFLPIDAPLPGVGPWEQIVQDPHLWQFGFGGPDMERLVSGRERIYLDRFWNDFSLDPKRFDEAKRQHYAGLYALPGAISAGFAQFAAFGRDAIDNKANLAKGKLTMPVLAIGGEAAFGTMMATVMRFAATDVQEAIVPDSGHWIMEENPSATIKLVTDFLKQGSGGFAAA
jgi:pimeloyl-ACP methyl ester carboxylesterase